MSANSDAVTGAGVCDWAGCDRPATRGATCLLHTKHSQGLMRKARAEREGMAARIAELEAALRASERGLHDAWHMLAAICEGDPSADRIKARDRAAASLAAARAALNEADHE